MFNNLSETPLYQFSMINSNHHSSHKKLLNHPKVSSGSSSPTSHALRSIRPSVNSELTNENSPQRSSQKKTLGTI